MAQFQQKIVTITGPEKFFSTSTVITWGVVRAHTSNTGNIFLGATSGSEGIRLTAGSVDVYLPKYSDVSTLFVNGGGTTNKAVLLYILQDQ